MTSAEVTFAGSAVAVDCHDAESAAIAAALYGHLVPTASAAAETRFDLRCAAGIFVLSCGETLIYRGPSRGMAAALLLDRSGYHLADTCRGGLLFHAACVGRGGKAIVLPGQSGAGKTTLAAWLTGRSFDYLTDELVFVAEGSTRVEAFRRPLNIKLAARPALAALVDFDDAASVLPTPEGFLVAPTVLNRSSEIGPAEVRMLIFPTFRAAARLELCAVSPARAGLLLLACLVNARALPDHGFEHTSRLASTVPAYSLSYGNLDQLEDRIEALHAAA